MYTRLPRPAVEHGRLDEFQVELRPAVQKSRFAGAARDGGEHDDLETVNEAGGELLPRSGKAAIRKGKGDKARTVPLNTPVRDALNGVRPSIAEGPVFRGKRGPYTDRGIRNLLAVLGRRADVAHVHPHRFRHDTARRLVEAVDLPTVAALLGHSRLDTIRIYAQPDEAALRRAAESLEKA